MSETGSKRQLPSCSTSLRVTDKALGHTSDDMMTDDIARLSGCSQITAVNGIGLTQQVPKKEKHGQAVQETANTACPTTRV